MSLDAQTTPTAPVAAAILESAKEGLNAPKTETLTEGSSPEAQALESGGKTEEDPKFAARFAALARRERQILERERALKGREGKYQSFEKILENPKNDPLAYLQAGGLSYEEITNHLISKIDSNKPLTADEKIAALERRIEEKDQAAIASQKEREQADLQAAVDQYKTNIIEHIGSNADKYELIMANEAQDLVFEVALQHWEQTGGEKGGQVMSYDAASEAVENYLEQQIRDKILKTKKFSRADPGLKGEEPVLKQAAPAPTLTNRNTVSAVSSAPTSNYLVDRDASIRKAAALLRFRK